MIWICLPCFILIELLVQLSCNWHFLRLQETFQEHFNCMINIIWSYVVSKVHLCPSFRHSNNWLNMSYCNWDTSDNWAFSSNIRIELCNFILINHWQFWSNESSGVDKILFKHLLWNYICAINLLLHSVIWKTVGLKVVLSLLNKLLLFFWTFALIFANIHCLNNLRMVLHVWIYDKGCKSVIIVFINLVLNDC